MSSMEKRGSCNLLSAKLFLVISKKKESGQFFRKGIKQSCSRIVRNISGKIQIKMIFKPLTWNRTGFDLGQVQLMRSKTGQYFMQRTCQMRQRKTQTNFIRLRRDYKFFGKQDKPRGVGFIVLNVWRKYFQPKPAGRLFRTNCRYPLFHTLRNHFCSGSGIAELDWFQPTGTDKR